MENTDKHKILIVESDEAVSALIGAALDVAGYRHTACSCDSTAFFSLQTDRFDLILLDIGAGCPAGLEMLEKLSSVETPLIFLVDRNSITGQIQGLQSGAEDFLLKPFEPADLLGRVEIVLSRSSHATRILRYYDIVIDIPVTAGPPKRTPHPADTQGV